MKFLVTVLKLYLGSMFTNIQPISFAFTPILMMFEVNSVFSSQHIPLHLSTSPIHHS